MDASILNRLNRLTAHQLLSEENSWTKLPSSLMEAKRVESHWYYTGKKCNNFHLAPKRTKNSTCLQCEASPERRRRNRELQERRKETVPRKPEKTVKTPRNGRFSPEEQLFSLAKQHSIPDHDISDKIKKIRDKVSQLIKESSRFDRFFIGNPCIHGHQPLRYHSSTNKNHVCYHCKLIRAEIYQLKNKESLKLKQNFRYHSLTPQKKQARIRSATAWNQKNPDKHLISSKTYVENNPERRQNSVQKQNQKPSQKKAVADWKKENPDIIRRYSAKRRNGVTEATPLWLSDEAKQEINMLYKEADRRSTNGKEPYEVDHIMPLNPRDKSKPMGLHVPWNLKVITRHDNRSLSDSLPPPYEYTAAIKDRSTYISADFML